MSETRFNNFVAIGASNRLDLEQVKLLRKSVVNEVQRIYAENAKKYDGENYKKINRLDEMGYDLATIEREMMESEE